MWMVIKFEKKKNLPFLKNFQKLGSKPEILFTYNKNSEKLK